MLAFPLLELGRMEEAAAASRKGYGINKEDALAHHCVSCFKQVDISFSILGFSFSCKDLTLFVAVLSCSST